MLLGFYTSLTLHRRCLDWPICRFAGSTRVNCVRCLRRSLLSLQNAISFQIYWAVLFGQSMSFLCWLRVCSWFSRLHVARIVFVIWEVILCYWSLKSSHSNRCLNWPLAAMNYLRGWFVTVALANVGFRLIRHWIFGRCDDLCLLHLVDCYRVCSLFVCARNANAAHWSRSFLWCSLLLAFVSVV